MAAFMDSPSASAQQALYTCMSCLVGFHSPLDQRIHYRSDLHRYNMKRQVAGLPPVRSEAFEEKVQQRDTSTAPSASQEENYAEQRSQCKDCAKSFASHNALLSHLNSRKHKELAAKATTSPTPPLSIAEPATSEDTLIFRITANSTDSRNPIHPLTTAAAAEEASTHATPFATSSGDYLSSEDGAQVAGPSALSTLSSIRATSLVLAHSASDAEVEEAINHRLASASKIDPSRQCIFCPFSKFASVEASLEHMQIRHGFFVPERSYLTDLLGLLQYLADKVAVGHMCLYCNGRGRSFNMAEAAQKHMLDKSHCKVAYEREEDRLELSDFYDFTSSYPDSQAQGEEWEDVEMSGSDDDEKHYQRDRDGGVDHNDPYDGGLRYGDSELELILPSGARLGHRSLARYYRQTLFSTPASVDRGGGSSVARRLIEQSRGADGAASALMVKDRNGGQVMAKSRGEAREAKRHIREFRDSQRREQFMTRVGFLHNSQKHFRDPLLQ